MAEFQITIDARGISEPDFTISPRPESLNDHHWAPTSTPLTVSLKPGKYQIGVHSCTSSLHFTIEPDGRITIDDRDPLQVQEGNPRVLKVIGREVTLDATYLAMRGAWGARIGIKGYSKDGSSEGRWIERETLRLLPGLYAFIEVGSAIQTKFGFTLLANGTFNYDPAFDISAQGFLEGRGTSTMAFRGYPVLVDASQLGRDFRINFLNIKGLPTDSYVMFVNLVPTVEPYQIKVDSTAIPGTSDSVWLSIIIDPDAKGQITTGEGTLYKFVQDTFHGLARLVIKKK